MSATTRKNTLTLPLATGVLTVLLFGAGVWLQLQDWVPTHPIWISVAGHLPAGASPFGVASKIAGGFGILTIVLAAFRHPKTADDPSEKKVTLYGVTPVKEAAPTVTPRRPVDFHARAQARSTQSAQPKLSHRTKRRFGLLRTVAAMGILALMAVIGLPLLNNGEVAAGTDYSAASVVQSVSDTVAPQWSRASALVAGIDYEKIIEDARVVVQGAISGQLEAQVRIGLCIMALVWLGMMLRATIKLLFRRRKTRPTTARLQFS